MVPAAAVPGAATPSQSVPRSQPRRESALPEAHAAPTSSTAVQAMGGSFLGAGLGSCLLGRGLGLLAEQEAPECHRDKAGT